MFHKRLLLLILVLLLLTLPVSADILWEPYDNTYYNVHSSKLDYMGRTYYVPDGMTANIYKSPSTGGLIKTVEAGTRLYVGPYLTVSGETWGAAYVHGDWNTEGWVRLDRLQRIYEQKDFENEFGASFVATDDQLTQSDIETEIFTWTYPGSGVQDRTIPKEALQGGYNDGVMSFHYVYTDPDGGRWGYVGYFMGRCGWVYLDDPETLDAPVFPRTTENTVTDTAPECAPHGYLWILPLIAVLVIGSACAIIILKKKSRSTSGGDFSHET